MRSCYCNETDTTYESIKACVAALNLPADKYLTLSNILRNHAVATLNGYHIGYSKEQVIEEMDTWKQPIPNIDLEVNRKGEVRKRSTKLPKSPTYNKLGYLYIVVSTETGSKAFQVHRLVAQAFLPNYDEHLVIDHLNGIRDDNRVENLCVKTQTENLAARDANNQPLYQELRRLVKTHGYEKTLEILKQF